VPLAAGVAAGPLGEGALVPAAWRGDRLVGLWPLRVHRWGRLRLAQRLGRDLQPYDGMLIDPEAPAGEVARALWGALRGHGGADLLLLRAVRDDDVLRGLPEVARAERSDASTRWLNTGALSGPDAVVRRLSRSRRKSLLRNRRALEGLGPLRLERLLDPPRRAAAVRAALALKEVWLDRKRLHSFAVGAPWLEGALLAAAAEPTLRDKLEIFSLTVGGEPVAYELGWRSRERYCSYLGAFSPAWREHGVGAELTACVLQWCVEQGIPRCDLLAPGSPFKDGWCDSAAPVWSARVPLTPRGHLLLPVSGVFRKLKPVYLQLHPDLRAGFNAALRRLRRPPPAS
jgi:CelD/BcsL family acetyltransferase involved in cellulose biosynthesis